MISSVESILVSKDISIRDAMRTLGRESSGILFVVDDSKRLIGTVTDGDIRRGILGGAALTCSIEDVMNKQPATVVAGVDLQEIRQIMLRDEIKQIPIIDKEGRIVDVVASALLGIPLSSPDITEKEIQAVVEVMSSPNLSMGPKVEKFETTFAEYIGCKYAIAVNSGTSGLHLCVKSLDIGDDDEVITTPFSFIASANSIMFERAKPVFVDIDPETLNIDVNRIEEKITKRTKAILPVHVFGHPCNMDGLMKIAKKHGLHVIEDACEAVGAEYKGKKVGGFGDCAVFAFYPNKQMTTGEGGIIVTDNSKIAELCRSYRNQGRSANGGWLNYERIGYNYRLSEIQSVIGLVQIQRIEELLEKRRTVAFMYHERLKEVKGIRLPHVDPNVKMSWFVYVVVLLDQMGGREARDLILDELRNNGIACNNYFPPIHLQPHYKRDFGYKAGDYPVAESLGERTIALPFYNNLSMEEVDRVCEVVKKCIRKVVS